MNRASAVWVLRMPEVRPKPKMPRLSFLTPQELHCCRKESFKLACTTSCRAGHFRTMARSLALREHRLMEQRSPAETAATAGVTNLFRTFACFKRVLAVRITGILA